MIGHISLGTLIMLVVAGITYGIIMAVRDIFPHTAPVHPKHTNFTHNNQTIEHDMAFLTVGNKTVDSELLKKLVYNQSEYFISPFLSVYFRCYLHQHVLRIIYIFVCKLL